MHRIVTRAHYWGISAKVWGTLYKHQLFLIDFAVPITQTSSVSLYCWTSLNEALGSPCSSRSALKSHPTIKRLVSIAGEFRLLRSKNRVLTGPLLASSLTGNGSETRPGVPCLRDVPSSAGRGS